MKGIRRFGHMSYHEVIRCSHRSSHKVIRVLPGRMLMNRISRFFVMLFFALAIFIIIPERANAAGASITDNGDGTIHFKFNNRYDARVKLLVQQSGGKMYQYDISKGSVSVDVPLCQGDGTYKIVLAKNISGTRYSVFQTVSINTDFSEHDSYLSSNIILDWEKTNKAIKKAESLTKGKKTDKEKFDAIYNYIVKNYQYDFDKLSILDSLSKSSSYIPDIDIIYSKRKGICYDISILMASMLRSVGIPTKVITGYTSNVNGYHAWNSVYIAEWKIVDVTYDLQMYSANRRYTVYKKKKDYSEIVYTY